MERAPLNSWAQMLELVDGNSPGLQHMTKGEYLSIRQVAPASEDVLLNRQLSSPLDLGELGSKADSENSIQPVMSIFVCRTLWRARLEAQG